MLFLCGYFIVIVLFGLFVFGLLVIIIGVLEVFGCCGFVVV